MKRVKRVGLICLALLLVLNSLSIILPGGNVAKAATAQDFVKGNADAKPYMGWSSYSLQVYDGPGNWVSEDKIKQQSDAMHEKLQSHGFQYINIDAGWNGGTDEYGRPIPSTKQYPSGFKNLVDYVHNNGQKIGIYCIPGVSMDAINKNLPIYGTDYHIQDIIARDSNGKPIGIDYWGFTYKIDFSKPGAQAHIQSIADLFHEWGIDFVKLDSVSPGSDMGNSRDARGNVEAWSKALAKCNIWLEISWAVDHNYVSDWKKWANGWRVDHDVEAYDPNVGMTQWANIARLFPVAALWWRDAGPGGWNDFDSLDVGNGFMDGLTRDERQTAATLWAVSCAQFYIGDDMTKLDSYGLSLLTNDEVIAVDQGGHPAHPVSIDTKQQIWYSNNGDGTFNVAVFNLGTKAAMVDVNWSDIGLNGSASVRDLWSHSELGTYENGLTGIELEPHASRLFKVTAKRGIAAVNDDDTDVIYTGNWTRNGGNEVAAQSQNLSVTVIDSSINPIPATSGSSIYINDNDSTIKYVGVSKGWGYSNNRNLEPGVGDDYNKDVHYTDGNGDYFVYTFNGTGIDVITEIAGSENADIYLDDTLVKHVDKTSAVRVCQDTLYSVSDLAKGTHTIKVVNTSSNYLQLDALKVTKAAEDNFLTTDTADFDGQHAVDITPVYGIGSVTGVKNGLSALTAGIDYTVSGSAIEISSSYLAQQQAGRNKLVFSFAGGSYQIFTVNVPVTSEPPVGAGSRYIMVNDNDSGIKYNGKWGSGGRNADWKDYMGDAHYGENDDAGNQPYFEYTFRGTGIAYYCELDPEQGNIDFYIDGTKAGTASSRCSGSTKQPSTAIWEITGLKEGMHTLKAVKADGATFMLFDALRIQVPNLISPVTATFDKNPVEQSGLHIFLTGNVNNFSGISNGTTALVPGIDYTVSGSSITINKAYLASQPVGTLNLTFKYSGDFQNDVHFTPTNGDSFQYSFTGTGIKLIGAKGPDQGEMDIYVDGELKRTVNTYNSARLSNQPIYEITDLESGSHTIQGVKKSGSLMLVDQLVFTIGKIKPDKDNKAVKK